MQLLLKINKRLDILKVKYLIYLSNPHVLIKLTVNLVTYKTFINIFFNYIGHFKDINLFCYIYI